MVEITIEAILIQEMRYTVLRRCASGAETWFSEAASTCQMGKVYIDWTGRLTFEIGKRRDAENPDGTDSPERIGEMIMSRLVAKELIFTGNDPKVFIQFAHYLDANDIAEFRKQLIPYNLSQLDAATLTARWNYH